MKNILITGASSGFGFETALRLAALGHHVMAGVKEYNDLTRLEEEATRRNVPLQVIKLDLLNDADIANLDRFDIDILFNNAGTGQTGPVADIPFERYRETFEVNLFGTFKVTQRVLKKMIASKTRGKILFVSSNAGIEGIANLSSYCGSKHALEALAASLKLELQSFGIKVATINPGPYKTGFNERIIYSAYEWHDRNTALTPESDYHRLDEVLATGQVDPEEMIQAMVDLIPKASHAYRTVLPQAVRERLKQEQLATWDEMI
ncbi:MAG: SDR family oxidoreductase [Comamonadaceae bacterium]|nr:MAG: SDR family oxidoreductase [Comamonadaceae bacterium]